MDESKRKKRGKGIQDRGITSETFDFQEDEIEFMKAIERYRKVKKIRFLSWHQVLDIVKSLGYRKIEDEADKPIILQKR